jgi:putative ABC transport system ATP-binding protein
VTVPVLASDLQLSVPTRTGALHLLRGVDLDVSAGELVAIAGRSGSGKTSLLLALAGLLPSTGGDVRVLGAPASPSTPWHDVALLPQSLGLVDELTIEENILLPLRLGDRPPATDPDELVDLLGLSDLRSRHPDEVSLGQQQRAAVARAVVVGPRVLLADEPISHQDEGWADQTMAVLARSRDASTACVVATHNAVAYAHADRVLELDAGRLRPR